MKEYRDYYFEKAKQENYPARSIYKLKEIEKRFKLFKKGMKVLDLGASPGSWSLGASEYVGLQGKVLACDIQATPTVFPPNIIFFQDDIFQRGSEFNAALEKIGPFHIIMSDMAPQTTGTRFTDQARSLDLCLEAFNVAKLYLQEQGSFIVKIFMGPDLMELLKPMRQSFTHVRSFKPKSSRSESKEIFYVGLGFKKSAIEAIGIEG